jgi:hypothetical protein
LVIVLFFSIIIKIVGVSFLFKQKAGAEQLRQKRLWSVGPQEQAD